MLVKNKRERLLFFINIFMKALFNLIIFIEVTPCLYFVQILSERSFNSVIYIKILQKINT